MNDAGVRKGVQSVGISISVLRVLVRAGRALALREVAAAADMPASKAHRYLASLVQGGLVSQDPRTGLYGLGEFALELGLAAMAGRDLVNLAADRLPELARQSGQTVLLSVYGGGGPTVVRWERSAGFVVTALGLGSALPLLRSATGQVFLAWLPATLTGDRLRRELREARRHGDEGMPADAGAVRRMIDAVRAQGYATVSGDLIPGLAAISAPVLDWQGEAVAALTLIGTDPGFARAGGRARTALLDSCRELSRAPL